MRAKVKDVPPDDDLLVGVSEYAQHARISYRQARSRIERGEVPIWFVNNVPQTRKSLLRAHDERKATEYLEAVEANKARGVKAPGRLKNVAAMLGHNGGPPLDDDQPAGAAE